MDPASMTPDRTAAVEQTLAAPDLHERWERIYHSPENARFFDLAIPRLVSRAAPRGGEALDAGCGPGHHSVRLARLGMRVRAVDLSEAALELARRNVEAAGESERVELRRASLLELPFPDGSFDFVLCWGVLMHVPEVERAVSELCRVVRPGGALVVGEGNQQAPEVRLHQRRTTGKLVATAAGIERWRVGASRPLVVREADVKWLRRKLVESGLEPDRTLPGQLSEAFAALPPRSLRARAVHAANRAWFRIGRGSRVSVGVFVIARRPAP